MNYFQLLQAIACICTIASFACTFFDFTTKDIDRDDRVKTEIIAQR